MTESPVDIPSPQTTSILPTLESLNNDSSLLPTKIEEAKMASNLALKKSKEFILSKELDHSNFFSTDEKIDAPASPPPPPFMSIPLPPAGVPPPPPPLSE